ncbi:DUF417 family protein, partial [Mycolicibacterium goodii]|nr:DUF417 family protein [Mycolicibacterium goodii]
ALLLVVKPWFPAISVAGSLLAILLFVSTLTFLFTTPGVGEASEGDPFGGPVAMRLGGGGSWSTVGRTRLG